MSGDSKGASSCSADNELKTQLVSVYTLTLTLKYGYMYGCIDMPWIYTDARTGLGENIFWWTVSIAFMFENVLEFSNQAYL